MLARTSLFVAAISPLLASTVHAQSSCAACDDVHFFLARGNNEPYPGRQGALVTATCDGLSSCGYEDLYYSALFTDLYCQTAYDGAIAGLTQMTRYHEMCPNSKLIMAGYSQGGQIAGDIMGGGGGESFNGCIQPDTPALDPNGAGKQVAAIIIFGDVRHNANESYNYGNGSSFDGWFPRNSTMLAKLEPYAPIMRNWCVSSDPICAANQSLSSYNEEDHLNYYDLDSNAAATWIRSVASLTASSSFTTAIPTSLSGTVQDYATIGTATPSGSVKLDTTWTNIPSSVSCMVTATPSVNASSIASTTSMNSSIPLAPTPSSGSGSMIAASQTGSSSSVGSGSKTTAGSSSSASSAAIASSTSNAGSSIATSVATLSLAGFFVMAMLLL